MAQQITKQTLIGEMLQMDMGIAAILMAAGAVLLPARVCKKNNLPS